MKKLDPVPDLNQEEVKMPWQKEVAKDWYEDYQKEKEENEKLRKELVELKKEIEKLKEKLKKLNQRTSENSSQPPSSDDYKKKFAKTFGQKGKKRGPKYDHVGKTRNLTFPIIFLFKRSPNFPLSQSPILSLSIIIKSSLLATAKSLKPLFCRRFQT
jgi:hypothetical protein